MAKTSFAALVSLVVSLLLAVAASDRLRAADAPKAELEKQITQHIEQLGSNEFANREEASRELTRIGIPAKAALTAATKSRDAEVRLRSSRILAGIVVDERREQLRQFMADEDGKRNIQLPGWKEFSAFCGPSPEVRKLFCEMYESDWLLFETIDQGPKAVATAVESRIYRLVELYQRDRETARTVIANQGVALLWLTCDKSMKLSDNTASMLSRYVVRNASATGMASSDPRGLALRKILGRWIARDDIKEFRSSHLLLAARYQMAEALPLAITVIKSPPNLVSVSQAEASFLLVGRFGGKSELPLLDSWLANPTVINRYSSNGARVEVRVGDIATAMSMKLSGKDPKEFGFESYRDFHDEMVVRIDQFGFEDDAARQAVLTKWKSIRAEQDAPKSDSAAKPSNKPRG